MQQIKLAIADDHKIFRNGVKAVLDDIDGFDVVLEASNGAELIEGLSKKQPDVILMDIKMPQMDGIQATSFIKKNFGQMKVLALSMYNEDSYILDMMRAGASGFLVKSAEPEEIIEAVKTVYERDYYFNGHLSISLIKRLSATSEQPNIVQSKVEFSDREKDILKLVCQEYSNQEIADRVFLSVRTVEGYRARLFEKTKSKNLVGLVIFAIKAGYLKV
jgi:DNA-binding NarL/FixJ family response regulator